MIIKTGDQFMVVEPKGSNIDLQTKQKRGARRAFNLQIPEALADRLAANLNSFEKVLGFRPSMTQIIVKALERELDNLEKKLEVLHVD